jgi:hypothetical protein
MMEASASKPTPPLHAAASESLALADSLPSACTAKWQQTSMKILEWFDSIESPLDAMTTALGAAETTGVNIAKLHEVFEVVVGPVSDKATSPRIQTLKQIHALVVGTVHVFLTSGALTHSGPSQVEDNEK